MKILDFIRCVKLRCNRCEGLNFFSTKKTIYQVSLSLSEEDTGGKSWDQQSLQTGQKSTLAMRRKLCLLSVSKIYLLKYIGFKEQVRKHSTPFVDWHQHECAYFQSQYIGHTGSAKSKSRINSQFVFCLQQWLPYGNHGRVCSGGGKNQVQSDQQWPFLLSFRLFLKPTAQEMVLKT